MPTLLGRGVRAALLLVTALGLALGLATTTVYDHPAESSAVETFCLTVAAELAAELAAPPTTLPDDAGAPTGGLAELALAVIAVAGMVFALVLGRARIPRLLMLPRAVDTSRAPAPVAASERRASSRPLLITLSVIRI